MGLTFPSTQPLPFSPWGGSLGWEDGRLCLAFLLLGSSSQWNVLQLLTESGGGAWGSPESDGAILLREKSGL